MDNTNYTNPQLVPTMDSDLPQANNTTSVRTIEPNRSATESTEQRLFGAYRNTNQAIRDLTPVSPPNAPLITPFADSFNANEASMLNSQTQPPVSPMPQNSTRMQPRTQAPLPSSSPMTPMAPASSSRPLPPTPPANSQMPMPPSPPTSSPTPTPLVQPTQPIRPITPTQSTPPTRPITPPVSTQPTRPLAPTPSTQPMRPVAPTPSTQPTRPLAPTPSAQPTRPIIPMQPTEPTPVAPQVTMPAFTAPNRTNTNMNPNFYTPIGDKISPRNETYNYNSSFRPQTAPMQSQPFPPGARIQNFEMDYNQGIYLPMDNYPFYQLSGNGYENLTDFEEAERDMEYLRQLYPSAFHMLQAEIEEECDKLEYEGSCMFDEYPDRITIDRIMNRIYDRVRDREELKAYDITPSTPKVSANQVVYNPCPQCNFLQDFIRVMFVNEMHNRRRRHRNRRRWFY